MIICCLGSPCVQDLAIGDSSSNMLFRLCSFSTGVSGVGRVGVTEGGNRRAKNYPGEGPLLCLFQEKSNLYRVNFL